MRLRLAVKNPSVSVLEAQKVSLELENDAPMPYRLPGPYDLTDALTIDVFRADGKLLRRMSGFTRQEMMSSARVDPTPMLEDLPAGGLWKWDLDLAPYHHPLPAGEFEVEAVYADAQTQVHARSNRVTVRIAPAPIQQLALLRDAPVLEGLTLLLRSRTVGKTATTVLRQHNAQRPLGAWYSEKLEVKNTSASGVPPVAWDGPVKPFFAAASFFTTSSFEPTFVKWIVSSDGSHLYAHHFWRGRPTPAVLAAALPAGRTLLSSACYDEEDRLMVFLRRPTGTIEAYDVAHGRLELRFEHDVPATALPPVIRADRDSVHVVTPWRGVLYDRLSLDGIPQERAHPFSTRMIPNVCEIDLGRRRARAIFRDGPNGRALYMAVVGLGTKRVDGLSIDHLPLRGMLREMSFDQDRDGHFHLLVSTSLQKLYYFRDGLGSLLIGRGEERYFPIVHASGGVYLGYNDTQRGYRFLQLKRAGGGHRIARFEERL